MKPRAYVETSFVSYLAARPVADVVVSAHQEITRRWWETRRSAFQLFCSRLVVDEVLRGDPEAAQRRLAILMDIPRLDVTDAAAQLAQLVIHEANLPPKAADDALHIAIASLNGMDYLLTWNCTHIANAENRRHIDRACAAMDVEPPIICTPEELLGE